PDGVFPQGADLQRDGLLVGRRDAGVEAGSKHFGRFPCLAKNPMRFGFLRCPFGGHSGVLLLPDRILSFSAMQDSTYPTLHSGGRLSAPASRGSSRASTPTALASVPRRAAATG